MRLDFAPDSVVVVAGLPGAGKTTLIRRAADRGAVRVIDTEDRREALRPLPVPTPVLHAEHVLRVARAAARPGAAASGPAAPAASRSAGAARSPTAPSTARAGPR